MVRFVNAKINIGLNIVGRRPNGYHDLETVFFPVGIESGLPHQPEPFDDILEITCNKGQMSGCRFQFIGRQINCHPKKNLVVKAATTFLHHYHENFDNLEEFGMFEITLDKHLPDGAGMGGGSADAAFVLEMLNEQTGNRFSHPQLKEMALKLGADCPFFLVNKPCFASGLGEELYPIDLNLKGYTLLIVKPEVSVSTADAFQGVTPAAPDFNLRYLPYLPVEEWKNKVVNDFEESVFKKFPVLHDIKEYLYASGAIYASMTGSGAALYGIYADEGVANKEREHLRSTYSEVWLFGL